jgi:tRNA pseudouridine13 synthase
LPSLEGDGIRVLSVSRHTNKLKPGHLHGNRFRILVRDLTPMEVGRIGNPSYIQEIVEPIVQRIREHGLPNFYGPQRFGREGETARIGLALLRGEPPPESSAGKRLNLRNSFLRKLILSAGQSALFNAYLAERLNDGLLRRVLAGDVMSKWPAGGLFVAEDVGREQERFDARETVTTGPIFGRKTFPAKDEAAARERAILEAAGLSAESFRPFGKLLQGTRRHNLVYVDELNYDVEPDGLRLSFTLPAVSYATVLLREVMKAEPEEGDGE